MSFALAKRFLMGKEREKKKNEKDSLAESLKVLSVPFLIGHTGRLEDKHATNCHGLTSISVPFPEGALMAYLGEILLWLVLFVFYIKASRLNLLNLSYCY